MVYDLHFFKCRNRESAFKCSEMNLCESLINVLPNGKCRSIVKMAIVVATVDFRS